MPSIWINRTIESIFQPDAERLQLFPVWLILGPRQVGKSSVLRRCQEGNRAWINLDDLETRARANQDPTLFLKDYSLPVAIDEIQYAPQLLSGLKKRVDEGCPAGSVWLTGSQNFEVMAGVRETLAGRVAILNLFGLSDEEKRLRSGTPRDYFESIFETTFPKLYGMRDAESRALYLASYVQTFIERDIREILGIQKRREFELFVRICALRTAQVVNYDGLAKDAGVSPATAKEWLSLLEDSFVIKLAHPYHTNKTKRLIKSPKLYFLDMGLAAYLAGWKDPEMLRLGPMAGAAYETHVFGDILRHFKHAGREVEIYFWRDRDGNEIDFIVETAKSVLPVEAKMGQVHPEELLPLKKVRDRNWESGQIISLLDWDDENAEPRSLTSEWKRLTPRAIAGW